MEHDLIPAFVVAPGCLNMTIGDDDQLILENDTIYCGVSRAKFMQMSAVANTLLEQEPDQTKLHLGVDVGADFMNLIGPCCVTGLLTYEAYEKIKSDHITDLAKFADFFQIENLLGAAARMIFEKAETGSDFGKGFIYTKVSVHILERLFPHEASDSARLHVLQVWARSLPSLPGKGYKPDDKAIKLIRGIDPTKIEPERLKFAADTMNGELFTYLRFIYYKSNGYVQGYGKQYKTLGWS